MFENDSKVHVLDHPLLQHKLSILRDERTGVKEFREIVAEIATLECYEATRDLPTEEVEIKTPVATGTFRVLAGKKLAIVPVLRAGLGMVDGILNLIPSAKVGHIGLYRDPETLAPVEYYCKMPSDIAERDVIVLDPMLATGGSAVAAIHFMKNYGCKAHEHPGRPRGDQGRAGGPPGRGHLRGRGGREAQRPRLYRPRPGGRGRPDLRHQVMRHSICAGGGGDPLRRRLFAPGAFQGKRALKCPRRLEYSGGM